MRLLPPIVLLLCICSVAYGQSTSSTGNFGHDLGEVYGAIHAAKMYRDICATYFPKYAPANAAAYKTWRAKYRPFLQEIAKDMSVYLWNEAHGNEKQYFYALTNTNEELLKYKEAMEHHMQSEGTARFAALCTIYPRYLRSSRMDLEQYYAEEMRVIRAHEHKN